MVIDSGRISRKRKKKLQFSKVFVGQKDWRQKEKETTEDEMVGWHHQLSGHEFEQAPGDGEGQGSLACCSPGGCKEADTTEHWTVTTTKQRRRRVDAECSHRKCSGLFTSDIYWMCTECRYCAWSCRYSTCLPSRRCAFDPCVGKIPLEEEMVNHSSILAWKIPWTEEPGGLQSIGLQRVGRDWSD